MALLTILARGNSQIEEGKIATAADVIRRLRAGIGAGIEAICGIADCGRGTRPDEIVGYVAARRPRSARCHPSAASTRPRARSRSPVAMRPARAGRSRWRRPGSTVRAPRLSPDFRQEIPARYLKFVLRIATARHTFEFLHRCRVHSVANMTSCSITAQLAHPSRGMMRSHRGPTTRGAADQLTCAACSLYRRQAQHHQKTCKAEVSP